MKKILLSAALASVLLPMPVDVAQAQGVDSKPANTRAALKQREDIARLNSEAEAALTKAGIVFHRPNTAPFRDQLRSAGFYKEWKGKFGDEAWAKLEKYAGPLA